jgi:hypothetical protein
VALSAVSGAHRALLGQIAHIAKVTAVVKAALTKTEELYHILRRWRRSRNSGVGLTRTGNPRAAL